MNKTRFEALSDGVFAIVMTLLVIEIHPPELHGDMVSARTLLAGLAQLGPLFLAYFVSFAVLGMFWTSHHALFHLFTKNVNRVLVQINLLYLACIALVPFSAHLLGQYSREPLAVILYGANILVIGLIAFGMMRYALRSAEIDTSHVDSRIIQQATIRLALTPLSTILGMSVALWSIPLALFLYAFPIVFNIIPGTVDFLERTLRLKLD